MSLWPALYHLGSSDLFGYQPSDSGRFLLAQDGTKCDISERTEACANDTNANANIKHSLFKSTFHVLFTILHCESKKQDTKLLSMPLGNTDGFSKYFHWYTQE